MSNFLEKNNEILFERDENEKLIPEIIILNTKKQEKIRGTPIVRGELKRILNNNPEETSKDTDKEIILNHCIEPKFTEKEVDVMKPYMVTAIVTGIFKISGLKEGSLSEKEAILKKKSISPNTPN